MQKRKYFFSQLKTSTQISLKFTLFTVLQVLLFSILANGIFFQNWYNRQQGQIPPGVRPVLSQKMILGKNRAPETEIFDIDSPEGETLEQSHRIKSIAKIDDMYFMYRQVGNKLLVTNVTPHIIVQRNLIWISIYLMIFFGIIAYISSLFFVKTSLRKLNELLGFLDQLHIDNLDQQIVISGHPQDEINRVSQKFNEVLEKIHKQTISLKDFVTNASHELKTPLMSMSTEIDYTNKTKNYETGLDNLKQQLKGMNTLLETLVTISKLETLEKLKKGTTDMTSLTETTLHDSQKIYQYKNIKLNTKIQKNIIKNINKDSRNIIVKNILENAYKFTPEGGMIDISLDSKKLVIKDTGKGISNSDIEHIRERFWQADRSKTDTKSFGLGLYLTKLLVEKHGRTITISSKINKGSVFTIAF
ncbi:MAG: HAMP domain-containing sensor histidine kinase [candidate division SR1 bacterium]|nr:HAMP domain-containing sensor histidine kinase [candidate division SR1 bacterium]